MLSGRLLNWLLCHLSNLALALSSPWIGIARKGQAVEAAVRGRPGKEVVVEHATTAVGLAPQALKVVIADTRSTHAIQQLFRAGDVQ
jgi:hypothetical protein